jgi:hypothetical protein
VKQNVAVVFPDQKAIMKQLKSVFKTTEQVFFHGSYHVPLDPLILEKGQVKITAHDVWKATGYRFR